ncbi:dienelactone hydrolase family protein [Leptolyngbya sp. 7M]|uniref:dienelactone hydrolase family protein n=1 Tax=Leptolyngbya sp. 7M TaxID=2812896 RepID=UPI001B8C1209|nr:dienelactone hydrolase family protein [Leptolyngbya sp. 7M]QYO68155.1 dienelactone hydrolase family protein [Leptolyngbya sp. 7M]
MTITDVSTELLTDTEWQIAHAIAQDLARTETDVNELGKAIAYLRHAIKQNPLDAGSRFFKYLKMLVSNGKQIGHSGKTLGYYRNIDKACSQHLRQAEAEAETMLQILGWAARLMRYYRVTPIGEISESTSEVQVAPVVTELKEAAAKYELPLTSVEYDADHAFFNNTRPEVYDASAAQDAWSQAVGFFKENL